MASNISIIDLVNEIKLLADKIIDLSKPESVIEKAAKKAAKTGSHEDLAEYLRLRRNPN